jgi:hypothetical protein
LAEGENDLVVVITEPSIPAGFEVVNVAEVVVVKVKVPPVTPTVTGLERLIVPPLPEKAITVVFGCMPGPEAIKPAKLFIDAPAPVIWYAPVTVLPV